MHRSLVCAIALFIFTSAPAAEFPDPDWPRAAPADVGLDASKLKQARDYALRGEGSGYIIYRGKLVMSWGDPGKTYDLKSSTKSFGSIALGITIGDGKIKLSDKASKHHPTIGTPPNSNKDTGWIDDITIEHLATQTAGFEKAGGYGKLLFKPGTKWLYSDAGPNWLAECITLAYKRDARDLMFERVFTPLGISDNELRWRDNAYRDRKIEGVARREFGSGIHANVDAMARIGYLMLNNGKWKDKQIIPADYVAMCGKPSKALAGLEELDAKNHGNASEHYNLLWWNNGDGTLKDVPRDAYWSWGLYDSLIVVIPSCDLVIARAGKSFPREWEWSGHYEVLRPFFEPITAAAGAASSGPARASATSGFIEAPELDLSRIDPRIVKIEFAAPSTIRRDARGSDNWPLTWADDGHMYSAYGDGWGFDPRVPDKLSLGLVRIEGDAHNFKGFNIRAATLETKGNDRRGKKASGILCIQGVLYLWARNAGNAQLAWSKDHGKTWTWADWKFTESFGCPTVLNFGKNYSGVPEPHSDYIYIYSQDRDDAYGNADQFVLARVLKDKITQREAYEFYAGMTVTADNRVTAKWSSNVSNRKPVFSEKGKCFRSGVSYCPAIQRYLWVRILPAASEKDRGLSIMEAREPWGDWHEVYRQQPWDIDTGESASLPVKWMSDDGKTMHLVFSGEDSFAVRKATITLRE